MTGFFPMAVSGLGSGTQAQYFADGLAHAPFGAPRLWAMLKELPRGALLLWLREPFAV
jgi:hypothetical protein